MTTEFRIIIEFSITYYDEWIITIIKTIVIKSCFSTSVISIITKNLCNSLSKMLIY